MSGKSDEEEKKDLRKKIKWKADKSQVLTFEESLSKSLEKKKKKTE